MHPRQLLLTITTLIIVPSTTTGLPTSTALATRDDATPATCLLAKFPDTPLHPPKCWSYFSETSPSNYCEASSFTTIPTTTTNSSSSSSSSTWLSDCDALRSALLSDTRDFFLAGWDNTMYQNLLTQGGCGFQVRPAREPTPDEIYLGGTDLTDLLGSALALVGGGDGTLGVAGVMSCGGDEVSWRVMPV
ncbi:hypothetical protein F4778DRAFT_488819 [Xylariomycetidae sp. FL2044]|nr:hypothetical protein F4778DRAFT_488819 [Xylariomycetidae sp. FL2044]